MTPSSSPRARGGRRRIVVAGGAIVAVSALVAAGLLLARGDGQAPRQQPAQPAADRPVEDLSRGGADPPRRAVAPTETPAFGMMAWRANRLNRADFALIRHSGARYYRFNLTTSTSGDRERQIQFGNFDRLIRAGVSENIEFLPVLLRSREKRKGDKNGSDQVAAPPETPAELATWRQRVRFYAQRYGPDGAFWRANPDLPYRPIRAWEVWNEPNLRQFWDGRKADPEEYGRLLVETRKVLRRVDPEARIVSAGLASRYDGADYLKRLLAEARGCRVDAIGIHPYAPTTKQAVDHLSDARRVADSGAARRVPLWTTEIGWRVGGRGYSAVATKAEQADQLRSFARATERRRRALELGPTFAFALRDRVDKKTGKVDHTAGLRGADDRPKPSWAAWSRISRDAPELALPDARRCRGERT